MNTRINISRKLEKVVPKDLIKKSYIGLTNPFGKWTATIFYVSHKKCLMLTSSVAKYSVILDRITRADFGDFSNIFTKIFYDQLLADGIEIDYQKLHEFVGEVELLETDNDRSIIGIQNSIMYYIEDWKYEFGHIDNWSFREINKRINGIPYKQLDWLFPNEKMKLEINLLCINA